ncbi:MipA/OmpV family protein [Vibrio rarus]|uniref:MipA/OmpV family protein n=1 Tax=Vibrio rarus TaxID=413403 RepID=UPI0021C3A0AF|nr:MipA/OmpV family protein [Vibrio rarus]
MKQFLVIKGGVVFLRQHITYLSKALMLFMGCVASFFVSATDISNSVTQGSRHDNGGYFEIGGNVLGTNQFDVRQTDHKDIEPLLLISGVYQYKGLFVEMVHLSQDGINLGYNFWNSEHWSLDFLAANISSTWYRSDNVDLSKLNQAQRNAHLMSDDSYYIGAGLRATRYWDDNYVFQFRAVSDYKENLGLQSTARLGKSWLVRNWNLYALGSVIYSSSKLTRNIYGVTSEEATDQFYQYKPSSAFSYGLEVGAAYPISQDVVFRSTYRIVSFSDEIADSPFSRADYSSLFNVSISYVF